MTVKDSFMGCIRKVTDNGIVYDLSKPIEERDIGLGCPLANKCPDCLFGHCKMDQSPFVCVCSFGWTGDLCDRRMYSTDLFTAECDSIVCSIGPTKCKFASTRPPEP